MAFRTEFHYGQRMQTFNLSFDEKHASFLPCIIEWIYSKRVPKVDNGTVWICLDLLNILCIPSLENIVFQYVEQRVTQFQEHFSPLKWQIYIKNTSLRRPNFLRHVMQTYFNDCNALDALEKYKAARDIILSQAIDMNAGYLIMDVIPFQELNLEELNHISKENLSPQVFSIIQNSGMQSSMKKDSGIDLDDETQKLDTIEELRNKLETTIGTKPMEILSLASEDYDTDSLFEDDERNQEVKCQKHNQRLTTFETLEAATEKLLGIVEKEIDSKVVEETHFLDPNHSFAAKIDSPTSKNHNEHVLSHPNHGSEINQSVVRGPISFRLDRKMNQGDTSRKKSESLHNMKFIPPNFKITSTCDNFKRLRSQSNIPETRNNQMVSQPSSSSGRTRSMSTYPISPIKGNGNHSGELKSTYSMYNLEDLDSDMPNNEELSNSKRVGLLDLLKGLF